MLSKLFGGSESGGVEVVVVVDGLFVALFIEELLEEEVPYTARLFLLKAGEYLECI